MCKLFSREIASVYRGFVRLGGCGGLDKILGVPFSRCGCAFTQALRLRSGQNGVMEKERFIRVSPRVKSVILRALQDQDAPV